MSDLPLPPPEGDTSEEAVGRGPRTRRFSGNERNQANGTTRAVPERAAFLFGLFGDNLKVTRQSLQRGTVPTSGNSPYIASMYVIAAVGNGFQPFRRAEEQPPLAPPSSGGHEQ